ncbi:MAG: RNA polymerase sigma factor [Chloroflexota bacterium]
MTIARKAARMPDGAQLAAAAKKDVIAFDALYRRYVTRVYRYCLLRCGDEQDAEDLTAQTFLAAIENLSTAETAAMMGKGQSAVKMLLLRALNELQERCLHDQD